MPAPGISVYLGAFTTFCILCAECRLIKILPPLQVLPSVELTLDENAEKFLDIPFDAAVALQWNELDDVRFTFVAEDLDKRRYPVRSPRPE